MGNGEWSMMNAMLIITIPQLMVNCGCLTIPDSRFTIHAND